MDSLNKELLLKYHKIYIDFEDYDEIYKLYKPKFKKFENIDEVTSEDIGEIAIGFANAWHSRTKNSTEICESVLLKLKEIKSLLYDLRQKNLCNIDLDAREDSILKLYDCFKDVKPTAVAKILYMLADNLFPIWDEAIRESYGILGNGKGYFCFMVITQKQLMKLGDKAIKEIEEKVGYPILKVIDEYNWCINNRST